jgi:hypothetical protein
MRTIWQQAVLAIVSTAALSCGGDEGTVPPAGAIGAGASGLAGTSAAGAAAVSGGAGATATAGRASTGASGSGPSGAAGSQSSVAGATAVAGSGTPAGNGAAGVGAGASGSAAGGGGMPAPTAMAGAVAMPGTLPHVMSTDGPGPWTGGAVKMKNTPPGGWLIYPKDIGKDGVKHPIFLFGPGGGTTPDTYESSGMHWDRYASYGFVIYAPASSSGNGTEMKAGLDWVMMQNEDMMSPLYHKLDTTKVAAAGHSQGSVTTFAFMPDERVTTTIHISGGSFDGMGPSKLKGETMFMCGSDNDVAKPQCDTDFTNTKVPTFYTVVTATHITSAREGWGATIAWLLWHLAGHDEWRKEFLEPTGQFWMGKYKSQIKNW